MGNGCGRGRSFTMTGGGGATRFTVGSSRFSGFSGGFASTADEASSTDEATTLRFFRFAMRRSVTQTNKPKTDSSHSCTARGVGIWLLSSAHAKSGPANSPAVR